MPVESVYQRLEPLLPRVRKPIAYVGGEVNSVVKDWDATDVRWALLYPDAYEVGLPNQGVQILYEVLNEHFGDWHPAGTLVAINNLSAPGARIELDMIAVIPSDKK